MGIAEVSGSKGSGVQSDQKGRDEGSWVGEVISEGEHAVAGKHENLT